MKKMEMKWNKLEVRIWIAKTRPSVLNPRDNYIIQPRKWVKIVTPKAKQIYRVSSISEVKWDLSTIIKVKEPTTVVYIYQRLSRVPNL